MANPNIEPRYTPPKSWGYEFDDLSTVLFRETEPGIRGTWDTDLDADQAIALICSLDEGDNIMTDFDLITVSGRTAPYSTYMESIPTDKVGFIRAHSQNRDKDVIWRGGGEYDMRPGFDTWFADKRILMRFLRDTASSDIVDNYEFLEAQES